MTVNTEIIILHTTKFGENSLVLHTLSRDYGRRSFLVRSVGKKHSMSLFLPLNILEADIVENPISQLYTAKNISAKHPLSGIRNNLYKNSISLFICEVLFRFLKEGACEPGMFGWCEQNILLLYALESDFSNFHVRFLLGLAVVSGFSPSAEDISPFTGEKTALLAGFMKSSFEESMLIPMSGQTRSEIAEALLRYIGHHGESALNIRSLKVLHELFR